MSAVRRIAPVTALAFLTLGFDVCPSSPNIGGPSLRNVIGSVTPNSLTLEVGESRPVQGNFSEGGGIAVVTMAVSNPAVAALVQSGSSAGATVTGLGVGTAVISMSARDNTTPATATVQVVARALTIGIAPNAALLAPGETVNFACTVTLQRTGMTVTDEQLDWSSSDTGVATVAQDGTVTAIADGTADITCMIRGRSESASAPVEVASPPTAAEKAGNYAYVGMKTADTCPAGLFPASVNNPGPILFEVLTFGSNIVIRTHSDTRMDGLHQPAGGHDATGVGTVSINGVVFTLIERLTGQWTRAPGIRLMGMLEYRLEQNSVEFCRAVFDAVYTKQ